MLLFYYYYYHLDKDYCKFYLQLVLIYWNQSKAPISSDPVGIYLFKAKNRNTRTRCEICSKLTIKTLERRHGVVLVSLLLTLNIFHTLF